MTTPKTAGGGLIFLLAVFAFPNDAWANGAERAVAAARTDTAPLIDGRLDEAVWATAAVTTGFIENKTERLAIEQTLVRVLYDDRNLYVAFECLEPDPNGILATERKDDRRMRSDDQVEVWLDTFHDHRCAYLFRTNPLGTRYDSRFGLFRPDESWDCQWQVACRVGADRWVAELAIPIEHLLFDREDQVIWGVNFRRVEKGRQENSSWVYNRQRFTRPRDFGHLTGLDFSQVKVPPRPSFETYVSDSADFERGENEVSTGVDVALRLNPHVTSAFTINPDFGQVEADPDTIELRDTERFLQERRPFFREGGELFETPLNIYYSRRLTDIDAGAKVTGQSKDWAFGLIDAQGEIHRDGEPIDGNYSVGRLIRNVGENSHVGAMWANSSRDNGNNITGGVDTRLFLNHDTYFTAQLLGMNDDEGIETDGKVDRSSAAFYSSIRGGSKPYEWRVSYQDIGRGFEPDLGFIPRKDIHGPSTELRYWEDLETGPLKWVSARSNVRFYENHNGKTTLRDFDESIGWSYRNEMEFWLGHGDRFHAPFQNRYDRVRVGYNRIDQWRSIVGTYEKGVFEEVDYDEFSLEKPVKLSNHMTTTVRGNYRTTHPDEGDQEAWLWRWVTEYVFVWEGRVKLTAEETSEDRSNLTLLFSWPVRQEMDIYLVLNDIENEGQTEQGAFTKLVYRF